LLIAVLAVSFEAAAQPAGKPKWVDAQDFLVRTGGEKNFTKQTPKVGVEFFLDPAGGALLAISEAGTIAAMPLTAIGAEKKAEWGFAHDLRARKADDDGWKAAKPYGVEAFKYPAGKVIVYVSEAKGLTLAELPGQTGSESPPNWHHGLVLKVRATGQAKFADAKTKIGVEAFKDGNTGGLIYITEIGQLASAAAPSSPPDPAARKADEKDFTRNTRIIPVEVFKDPNSGALLYVSETGHLAAVPAPATVKDGQGLKWSHAMTLKARKGGEKEFASAAKYGVEAFVDNNTGYLLYVCETGSVAVVKR
jgi:hypothetical protein